MKNAHKCRCTPVRGGSSSDGRHPLNQQGCCIQLHTMKHWHVLFHQRVKGFSGALVVSGIKRGLCCPCRVAIGTGFSSSNRPIPLVAYHVSHRLTWVVGERMKRQKLHPHSRQQSWTQGHEAILMDREEGWGRSGHTMRHPMTWHLGGGAQRRNTHVGRHATLVASCEKDCTS